jgi:DNA-binding PadR family transcriptional regulator
MTEKEKFFKKLEEKRKNGLKSVFFAVNEAGVAELVSRVRPRTLDQEQLAYEEEIYAELNRMEEAEDEEDPRIFKKADVGV